MLLRKLALCAAIVLTTASCTTSQQGSAGTSDFVSTTRKIVGTDLIGVKGKTPADQNDIDDTVAGLCGSGVYNKGECQRHQDETEGG